MVDCVWVQVISSSRSERIAPFTGLEPGQFRKLVRVVAQVAIVDGTRLAIATGDPQPGNRNDCTVYRDSGIAEQLAGRPVMADGGYRGNPGVIMPYRQPRDGSELPDWKEQLNTVHRKVRARVEHALGGMKNWKILRDHRRAGHTLAATASAIAFLHNLTITG